jgi:hypothetical protein
MVIPTWVRVALIVAMGMGGCGGKEPAATPPDAAPSWACDPGCQYSECTPDGCEGDCGECPENWHCQSFGQGAYCVSDCEYLCSEYAECGFVDSPLLDGCDCGPCPSGEECISCWPNNEGPTVPVCCPTCESICGDAGVECGEVHDECGSFCADFDFGCACGDCTDGVCVFGECCQAICEERECGDDGCYGVCGICSDGSACSDAGKCECIPDCEERQCGGDGCGGSCGSCPCAECDPCALSCSEQGLCYSQSECDYTDCSYIFSCLDSCPAADFDCPEDCVGSVSIETQMTFYELINCLDEPCYYFGDCPSDVLEICHDEYYACFPPGIWDCEALYACVSECDQEDSECGQLCLVEGSIEGLEELDALIGCFLQAGRFECAEDDTSCLDEAQAICSAELAVCVGCKPDCAGKPPDAPDGCGGLCHYDKACAIHEECGGSKLCLRQQEQDGQPTDVCGLCAEGSTCVCGAPLWSEQYICTTDADCETNLMCGDQCDDCAPCPKCMNSWCAYETFEMVECLCTGCA